MTNDNISSQQAIEIDVASVNYKHHRIAYIDNLKWLTIIFVIMLHTAVTYSGLGSWYYKEPARLGIWSVYFFMFFQTHLQAYFMSLFFMIAAYFIPGSLQKKGPKKFIIDRLIRLGIPTLLYIFLINPAIIKLAHPHEIHLDWHSFTSLDFLSGSGPMWFALTLLIFSIIYSAINRVVTKLTNRFSFAVNIRNATILIGLITISAFLIRLIYPIGTAVFNLQFCFFAAYIFMFIIGTIAYKKNLLEKITLTQAKKWFIAAFAIIPLWLIVTNAIIKSDGSIDKIQATALHGGWHWLAFFYAFWESFFCVAIIIGLVGIFRHRFNTQNALQKFLSTNAFGVYVFHPIILVLVSLALKNLEIWPILKFIIVSTIVVPLSFMFAASVRKISFLRKIFS